MPWEAPLSLQKRGPIRQNLKISLPGKHMQSHSDRRNMLDIFYDLLNAIIEERVRNRRIVRTRLQHRTNIAYNRMTRYLKKMENFGLISDNNGLNITEKGINYFTDYSKINDLLRQTNKKYFHM